MKGLTPTEMSKELNLPLSTVKQRLRRAGCKPFCQEALYTRTDFENIKKVLMGRPKKTDKPPATPTKKSKKKDR